MSPGVIVKGFKKCCISSAIDETEDMLLNMSEEGGNVRSECEKDEGTDCADGDSDTDW
jgi:hypothetical protein